MLLNHVYMGTGNVTKIWASNSLHGVIYPFWINLEFKKGNLKIYNLFISFIYFYFFDYLQCNFTILRELINTIFLISFLYLGEKGAVRYKRLRATGPLVWAVFAILA